MTMPNAMEHGVTLWGAPGAGKSGLLGALYAASLRADARGWFAHPKDCEDAYTQERLKDAYLGLRGRTNTKTGLAAPGGEYPPLRAVLRRGGDRAGELRVAIVDPAGEYSTQLDLGATAEGRALFARVARGSGLLWLVESGHGADDVAARVVALQHLVALLEQGGGRQLAIPVALCLSKTDRLTPAERAAAHADPADALRARLGETAFTWFEAACPRLRCFAVSSTGAEDGRVQPEGLDAVLDWLADESRPRPTLRERAGTAAAALGALAPKLAPKLTPRRTPTLSPNARRLTRSVLVAAGLVGTLGTAAAVGGPRVLKLAAEAPLTRRAATGEVARPAPRREPRAAELSADVAEARLGGALDAAERGDWRDALGTLGAEAPPADLRFAWDSLYVTAAVEAARSADDDEARWLRALARARADEVIRRGPAGSRRLVPVRFARGVACVDGNLDCATADVTADLTWALLGPGWMRREARDRLAALGAGGRP